MSSETNGTATTAFSKQQIQQCQEVVQNLRVHELHQLLSIFKYPKLGKKQELVERAQAVLSNPRYQAKAAQKVLEIQAGNRIREAMNPYSPTGNINVPLQQHPYSMAGSGGPMSAAAPPSVSSPSVIAGVAGGMLHPGSAAAAASGMARGSAVPTMYNQQQQILANANATYAANFAAYQHQFFQQMVPHSYASSLVTNHHQQPTPLMAAATAAAAQQQLHHHSQQNGQQHQQFGAGQHQQQQHHVHIQHPRVPQQQPTVLPQHGAGGQLLRDLRTVELPFYDQIKVIVPMTELPAYPIPNRPQDGRVSHSFSVPSEDLQKVHYRSEEQPLPRYELQLRMFLLETSEEQQDAFPPGCVVKIDSIEGGQVQLPPIIPTNKPNAEQKRYPRPVNITPYVQPPRGRQNPHRMHFEWSSDKRAWAFTVTLVKRLNSEILLDRILKNPNARRPLERTKQTIMRRLNGDEDDVQMDSLKISLMDPLMRTRIKIPARAAECTHLQSFDLNSYLMMSEKRPTWKCPVCDRNAIYSKLIIDAYFEQVLSNIGAGIDEVELLRNGTWRVPVEPEAMGLDSDDENVGGGGGTATASAAAGVGDAVGAKAGAGDDDNDDDIMVVTMPVPKKRTAGGGGGGSEASSDFSIKQPGPPVHQQQQPQAQQQQKRSTAAPTPDIDIICLSSDDEQEAENRQMERAIAASTLQQHEVARDNNSGISNRSSGGGGGTGCAPGTSSSTSNSADSSSTSSSSATTSSVSGGAAAAAATTTAQNGRPEALAVGGATGTVRYSSDRLRSIGSGGCTAPPPSINSSPILRVNGVHPPVFRPIINEMAKRQISNNLALFLQQVYAKNNKA